jgi:signal transduction histidine kinase
MPRNDKFPSQPKIPAIFLQAMLSVPVRIKVAGIMILPVLILGLALNYWVQTGLSDWLSYLLSDDRVSFAMQAGGRSVLLVTILAAIASILLTFILMYFLTQPLLELRKTAQQIINGNLSSRARIFARDEIGEVARSMNVMIDQLVHTQQMLECTNAQLSAMNRVAMAAERELGLQKVLNASLTGMLEVTGLKTGWVFLFKNVNDPSDNHEVELITHQGLEKARLLPDILVSAIEPCACLKKLFEPADLHSIYTQQCTRVQADPNRPYYHISIPIKTRQKCYGLINLLCEDKSIISSDTLDLLEAISVQVSEIVANAWLHDRLVEKEIARQALVRALVKAQEDERMNLARELHDGAGQMLTTILVRLKTLQNLNRARSLNPELETLCDLVSETIKQMRELSRHYRPASLEEFGIEVALSALIQDTSKNTGLKIDFYSNLNNRSLPYELESALFRIAQESLTNIVRHAKATQASLRLTWSPYGISMSIEDNGQGFDVNSITSSTSHGIYRLGLIGMHERTELMGGSFKVFSAPGEGTSIQVLFPYPEDETVNQVNKWQTESGSS